MQTHSIKSLLSASSDQESGIEIGSIVEIKGWIRTTRDSKGGFDSLPSSPTRSIRSNSPTPNDFITTVDNMEGDTTNVELTVTPTGETTSTDPNETRILV